MGALISNYPRDYVESTKEAWHNLLRPFYCTLTRTCSLVFSVVLASKSSTVDFVLVSSQTANK